MDFERKRRDLGYRNLASGFGDVDIPRLADASSIAPLYGTYTLGVGVSVEIPNCSPANPDVDLNRYQMPVDGLNTARSARPSPS